MKTKILLIALATITLLSFTLISTRSTTKDAKKGASEKQSGFVLQDDNQF